MAQKINISHYLQNLQKCKVHPLERGIHYLQKQNSSCRGVLKGHLIAPQDQAFLWEGTLRNMQPSRLPGPPWEPL